MIMKQRYSMLEQKLIHLNQLNLRIYLPEVAAEPCKLIERRRIRNKYDVILKQMRINQGDLQLRMNASAICSILSVGCLNESYNVFTPTGWERGKG